jgi:phage recombination protein Bet
MSNLITTQINQLAERFELPQSEELYQVLKSTAFKGDVSDAQLSALLIVAKQYGLNPWTKEIYAFPDKGGIVPVVGVDGWSRIINSNQQFDGMDFEQDEKSCTCVIYRKDRKHPIKVTEWMAECKRSGVKPWESHPYRMLRHKAMIQCARIAFGFGGIYDDDEAARIVENTKQIDPATGEIAQPQSRPALPACPEEKFSTMLPKWRKNIDDGGVVSDLLSMLQSKYTLTTEQVKAIKDLAVTDAQSKEPAAALADDPFVQAMQ